MRRVVIGGSWSAAYLDGPPLARGVCSRALGYEPPPCMAALHGDHLRRHRKRGFLGESPPDVEAGRRCQPLQGRLGNPLLQ